MHPPKPPTQWRSVRRAWGMAALLAVVCGFLSELTAAAQTTGTNTVTLVADNVTNASNTLTPIVIGVSIIWIVWQFVKKVGKKAG